jgi:plasmid stability protein
MRQLTIRKVSAPLGRKLDELSARTGKSVNTLVLELLDAALGTKGRRDRLRSYATWSPADAREFEAALAPQRKVDEDLWR